MTLKYYVKGREDVSKVTASVIDAAYRSEAMILQNLCKA